MKLNSHKKIHLAVGHPFIGRGGSEAFVMWALESLKNNFDLTLITTNSVDFEDLNRCYGTNITSREINVKMAPVPWFMKNRDIMAAWRGPFYAKFCRKIAKEFDLCISGYNLTDWGRTALHFIADLVWDNTLRCTYDPVPGIGSRFVHRQGSVRSLYLALAHLIHPTQRSLTDFFRDPSETIVVNSRWTGKLINQKYNRDCLEVLYPPVAAEFIETTWEDKEFGFVSIGRIAPEKRVDTMIEILSRVRKAGFKIHFHIIGGLDNNPYSERVRNLVGQGSEWIHLEEHKAGRDKSELLRRHRFAIHGRPYEAFGISVAEFVKAGAIPFIPNTGGQTEIVPCQELQYANVDEAVGKIVNLLRNEGLQEKMRERLRQQAGLFKIEFFKAQFKEIVQGALEKNKAQWMKQR